MNTQWLQPYVIPEYNWWTGWNKYAHDSTGNLLHIRVLTIKTLFFGMHTFCSSPFSFGNDL